MENYEEKYKQGLECIQEILSGAGDKIKTSILQKRLQPFFPELAKGEDGKIRKEIMQLIQCMHDTDPRKERWITWLEKQGELNNNETDILNRFSFYSYKDEPNILYLSELYVNKEQRNKGIGTKILKITDEVAANMKCNSIRLKTEIGSNAERLYRKNGYNSLKMEGNQIWLEKQSDKIVDCPQNHQDVKHPNWIVMEDFNDGEGFYKLHLDYLNKKQVEDIEEMVRTWNKEQKTSNENIKNCIGMCLTDANEQRFKNYGTTLKDCLDWLEKQGDSNSQTVLTLPKFTFNDVLALQCCMETVKKVQEDKELYEKLNDLHSKVYDSYQLGKQGEQSVEPNWCHHKVDLSNCSEEYCKAYYDGWNNCNMQHSQYKAESNNNDEKIRKSLINFLKSPFVNENITDEKVAPWIDWLEKQGEQKPIDYNEELKKCRENPLYFINKYVKFENQKPAWSEKDKNLLNRLIGVLDGTNEEDYHEGWEEKFLPWLKSLKERMQPQPKQCEHLENYDESEKDN